MSTVEDYESQQLECALIVLYFPEATFWDYLQNLSKHFKHILLIDNTPPPTENELNASKFSNTTYYSMGLNTGISKALNIGCKILFERGANYLVCFDQDTRINSDYSTIVTCHLKEINLDNTILGSGFSERTLFNTFFKKKAKRSKVTTLITSGTIISKSIFSLVGEFNENYFIDSVDHEYSLRARTKGTNILKINQKIMTHFIGDKDSAFPIHTSTRKYFIFRNVIFTIRRHWANEPIWTIKQILRLTIELAHVVLTEKDKKEKLLSIYKGITHGIKDNLGHYE